MKNTKDNPIKLILLGALLLVLLVSLFLTVRASFGRTEPKEAAAKTAAPTGTPTPTGTPFVPPEQEEIEAPTPEPTREPLPTPPPVSEAPTPEPTLLDIHALYDPSETTQIRVYDHRTGERITMDLEEYVVGVVAAEMPYHYSYEALKAQAVTTRTYTLYSAAHGGCHTDPESDVCTNSKCCQAFSTRERMENAWGKGFILNYNRVAQAVMDTKGEVIVWRGKLCDAMYHACSGGQTENSENVYANAIPYLRGVASPYEDPMREEDTEIGTDALAALIAAKYPESGITPENVRDGIAIVSAYESGRVKELRLGKTKITGKQARSLFGLRSTMFTFTWKDEGIVFHTVGFGHGVGLSQNGANGMAKHGSNYREILLHYFTGVTIEHYGPDGIGPAATSVSGEEPPLFVPED